jgi:uncharacterized protein
VWVHGSLRRFGRALLRPPPKPITVEELIATYERLDLGGVLLGWDAERATGRPPLENEWLARVCARSEGRFVGFGSIDPLRPETGAQKRVRKRLEGEDAKNHFPHRQVRF